jgi:hypothetical protein
MIKIKLVFYLRFLDRFISISVKMFDSLLSSSMFVDVYEQRNRKTMSPSRMTIDRKYSRMFIVVDERKEIKDTLDKSISMIRRKCN